MTILAIQEYLRKLFKRIRIRTEIIGCHRAISSVIGSGGDYAIVSHLNRRIKRLEKYLARV